MQLKIREKSVALLVFCAIAPLCIASVGSYYYAQESLNEFVEAELSLVTRDSLDELDRQFAEAFVDLETWSKLRVMQDVLIDDEENEISGELVKLRQQYPFYAELLVVNQNGVVVASAQVEDKGRDLSDSDVVSVTRGGEAFQGWTALSEAASRVLMVFASPVVASYDPTTVIGTLIGVIDWKHINNRLAEVSMAGAKQDENHVLILTVGPDHRVLYETSAISDTKKAPVLAAHRQDDGFTEITAEGTTYTVSSSVSQGIGTFAERRWELHAAISTDVAFASVIRLRTQALLVGFLASLLAFAIGWLGANSLVRPISALIATMNTLAQGKDQIEIPCLNRKDEIGSMAQALEVFKNVNTKLKRNESQLELALDAAEGANRAKSVFLANMSHELRTPLNAIIGFSDIIKDERLGPVGSTKYREYADDINESGQHLLALINDILDLSKVESGSDELHEENIEISQIAKALLKLVVGFARKGNIELELDVPDDTPLLYADERKVKQTLLNLLSNAIKFTPDGGKVTLKIWSRAESGYVFQVTDTGIGIATEDIPRALAPFQQIDSGLNRKHDGTGLGLSLTKSLVEMHGGYLDLQSKVGVGTTVTVRFPAERIVGSPQVTKAIDAGDRKAG